VIIEGRDNLVEKCLRSREVQILNNISVADMPIGNIKLVDTRSVVTIPLVSAGNLIGAVVIQQDRPEGFPDQLISTLLTSSDQLAVSLQNALIFEEARTTERPSVQGSGEWSKEAWRKTLQSRRNMGYYFDGRDILPIQGKTTPERPARSGGGQEVITIPIQLYGQTIGHIEAVKPAADEAWTNTEKELLKTITERLEVAIDSARLYEETQKRAEGERIVGEVTTRLRETLDIDTVLRTAAAEMRSVFDLEEVEVRLTSSGDQSSTTEIENGS
jgi:GAF domain-containing protein